LPPLLKYLLLITFSLLLKDSRGALCNSTGDGLWTNAATWSCGHAPACGDSVVILAGHTVSITSADYNGCGSKLVVVIRGTLEFTSPGLLKLACTGRLYVFSGGRIIPANGSAGNSNAIQVCGSTWWNAAAGTFTGPGCMPPTLPGCANVLPIELLTFDGMLCDDNKICLKWETASERGNDHFEISRSVDAVNFDRIAQVKTLSQGNSHQKLTYSYTDPAPYRGINYYRLSQVDVDESTVEFPLIEIKGPENGEILYTIYPNPSGGDFKISSNNQFHRHALSILITNMLGEKVLKQELSRESENEDFVFYPESTLSPGIYYCSLGGDLLNSFVKIIIQ
jgi:hypothetical protein